MKKFDFRLEAVRKLRERSAAVEQERMSKLLFQLQRTEQQLAAMDRERSGIAQSLRASPAPSGVDLHALAGFYAGWELRRKNAESSLHGLKLQIGEQRTRLAEAKRAEQALNKLRDKRFKHWEREAAGELERTAQELWLYSHTTDLRGSRT